MLANSGNTLAAGQMLSDVMRTAYSTGISNSKVSQLAAFISQKYGIEIDADKASPVDEYLNKGLSCGENILKSKYAYIYIVTPAYNSAETIDKTIQSVIYQKGSFRLCYHIQDGGSTDGTIEILRKWESFIINNKGEFGDIKFSYSSEEDGGMYDAIYRGFAKILPPYDVWMGWINSDDIITHGTFQFLSDVSCSYGKKVAWVTGMQAVKNDENSVRVHDIHFSSSLIAEGLCDGKNWWFLQQEGTFWRKSLWDKIDIKRQFKRLRYAGDWYLWYRFAKSGAIVFQARMPLGIFCSRPGQLSQLHLEDYLREIDSIVPFKIRNEFQNSMVGKDFQVHHLERIFNLDAIVMSSSLATFLGAKYCFPSVQEVKMLSC